MQLLMNEVEKLSREVDANNPYSHKLAQVRTSINTSAYLTWSRAAVPIGELLCKLTQTGNTNLFNKMDILSILREES